MVRSLKASSTGIKKAFDALTDKAWTYEKVAEQVGCSRQPINKFFTAKPVKRELFVKTCQTLELDWREIADFPKSELTLATSEQDNSVELNNIETVVQQVRRDCYERIQYLCGNLRMLDISRPIALTDIFTEVNVLEQINSQQWRDISELAKGFNPEYNNFDRLGLGRVRQTRISGLDAISQYQKLMVLGKPGSGKTTFLQHVAIQCNQGKFEPQRVPILIRLKEFSEDAKNDEDLNLLNYLIQDFNCCKLTPESTHILLNEGRLIILLDGLDEVADKKSDKIIREICSFTRKYYKNYFVITCRVAATSHQFQGFTDVEVADFNLEQVQSFAQKWFVAVAGNNPSKGEALAHQFINQILQPKNQAIRELAVTPILLNLTCLVFQAKSNFPSNRAKLYEQGLDILLRRWDAARGIRRDEIYQALTLEHKKQLLAYLAAITFEQGSYFFEKSQIQKLIVDYLGALPSAKSISSEMQSDSEAVLKSIEAQHGLLVERARGIYSFSHLTFQEYFTVQQIIGDDHYKSLEKLVSHINCRRWQEILLLTTGILQNADNFLVLMKQRIDRSLAEDETLQQFMTWLNQKALSVNAPYQQVVIRAFYLGRQINMIEHKSSLDIDPVLILEIASALDPTFDPPLDLTISTNIPYKMCDRDFAIDIIFDLAITYVQDLDIPYPYARASAFNLVSVLTFATHFDLDPEFKRALNQLKEQLPGFPEIVTEERWWVREREWWEAHGPSWTEQLIKLLIKYRNIGHNWQWKPQQKNLLIQYYFANKLLLQCLKSAYEVTPSIREEIEETLLLPTIACSYGSKIL